MLFQIYKATLREVTHVWYQKTIIMQKSVSIFNGYQFLIYFELSWMWKWANKYFYKSSVLLPPLLTGLTNNFRIRAFNEKHESCFMTIYGVLCTWDFCNQTFLTVFVSVIRTLKMMHWVLCTVCWEHLLSFAEAGQGFLHES